MNFQEKLQVEDHLLFMQSSFNEGDVSFTLDQKKMLYNFLKKGGQMDRINTLEEEVRFLRSELQKHLSKIDALEVVIEQLELKLITGEAEDDE